MPKLKNTPPKYRLHRASGQAVMENWDEPFATARKLEQKGDLHGAALIYDELVQRGIEQPKILHRLAVCYDLTDRPQLSLPLYERALDLDPQNSDILCDLGYRLQLVGNMTAAERFYTQALQYDQNHARANNHLGVLLAQDDRNDQALRCFQAGGLNLWQAKRNLAIAVQNRDAGLAR